MSMIPGLGNGVLDKNNEKESIKKVKRFLCIIDSMNDKELDGVVQLNPSRITRIARGSGTTIEDVNQLLEEYKRLAKVFEKIGKANLGKGNDMSQMMRNPG